MNFESVNSTHFAKLCVRCLFSFVAFLAFYMFVYKYFLYLRQEINFL